jgi:Holliday junction resolvase RusA-like endonuclease
VTATLVLKGHCPSKKNLWKRGKGGRTYIDHETAAIIAVLTAQAKAQWKREPVTHPNILVQFYVRDKRRDRDNMLTTLLDCLCKAGVLVNDNMAQCNGLLVVYPALVDKNERAEVCVTKRQ